MKINSLLPFVRALRLPAAAMMLATAAAQSQATSPAAGVPPLEESASRKIVTRDPSTIVACDGEFWMFFTGRGVPSYHSKDLVTWIPGPPVFQTAPAWISRTVPENRNMVYWAPDVMRAGDQYLLYYSVSSFGKITSAIGLATNPTLNPADPAYRWTDRGMVVQSHEGGDFNAIDPAVFHDEDGGLWLTFGSYWSGIKLIALDPETGKRLAPNEPMIPIAFNGSIEASYLTKKDGWYYLFINWGSCCEGAKSTYNIRVGRSRKITGPYLDKSGADLLHGGGSVFLATKKGPLTGPGHAGIVWKDGREWFSCHFEGDDRMGGKATLGIMPLRWNSDGWPEADLRDQ